MQTVLHKIWKDLFSSDLDINDFKKDTVNGLTDLDMFS
jgi:hypothetical protein